MRDRMRCTPNGTLVARGFDASEATPQTDFLSYQRIQVLQAGVSGDYSRSMSIAMP